MTAKELIAALRNHDQSVQVKVRGSSGSLVKADLGLVIFPSGACLVLVPEGDISWPRGTKPRRRKSSTKGEAK